MQRNLQELNEQERPKAKNLQTDTFAQNPSTLGKQSPTNYFWI